MTPATLAVLLTGHDGATHGPVTALMVQWLVCRSPRGAAAGRSMPLSIQPSCMCVGPNQPISSYRHGCVSLPSIPPLMRRKGVSRTHETRRAPAHMSGGNTPSVRVNPGGVPFALDKGLPAGYSQDGHDTSGVGCQHPMFPQQDDSLRRRAKEGLSQAPPGGSSRMPGCTFYSRLIPC